MTNDSSTQTSDDRTMEIDRTIVLSGGNSHHVAEAMFKSFAKALDAATQYDSRITDVLSTKGSL